MIRSPCVQDKITFFDRLIWQKDRMLLDDLVFRLEHYKNNDWELGEDCFISYKIKGLVDQYQRFWQLHQGFRAENVFELGIWDCGSIAFWFEFFCPRKHVAIDLMQREDSPYFRRYVASRGLEDRIETFWSTDQGDKIRLIEIARSEFASPLDLVIDDASHLYLPTRSSFEALFPLLRSGGFYVIEDWAWSHWQEFQSRLHPCAAETELTKLVFELVEAAGTSPQTIGSITISQGFVVVERGETGLETTGGFDLEDYISRRPAWSRVDVLSSRIRRRISKYIAGEWR